MTRMYVEFPCSVQDASATPALPDIDSVDAEDPLAATDFVSDIFSYYKRVEPQLRVAPDYMSRQAGAAACAAGVGCTPGGSRPAVRLLAPLRCAVLPPPADPPPLLPRLPRLQGDINEKMRAILIDWLVDVHLKFKVGGGGGMPLVGWGWCWGAPWVPAGLPLPAARALHLDVAPLPPS